MAIGYIVAVLLLFIAFAAVVLEKVYFYLPARELNRRAVKGDRVSEALARVAHYGDELRLMLVLIVVLSLSSGLVLLVHTAPISVGLAAVFIAVMLIFFWLPRTRLTSFGARFAAWCALPLAWYLEKIRPVWRPIAVWLSRHSLRRSDTGLYERGDLTDLLERQQHQRDSRINPQDLELLRHVLQASECTVGDLITLRKQVIAVNARDQISPVMVNELHQTTHPFFPVYEDTKDNIIGVLAISRIADVHQHSTVMNSLDGRLAYLNQSDSLERAVSAWYETHQHLFIVVDDHEKYVGILTLSDIFFHLFGPLPHERFDHFDDRTAVAHQKVAKERPEVIK